MDIGVDSVLFPPIPEGEAPPAYEEVFNLTYLPSYETLFGQVQVEHVEPERKSFAEMLACVLFGIAGGITWLVIYAMPLCMIIMGTIYLHDCPEAEIIPVYLIVGGILATFNRVSSLYLLHYKEPSERRRKLLQYKKSFDFLMLGWFIFGCACIYNVYEPNYDRDFGLYCNKTLYLFAFWLITVECLALLVLVMFYIGYVIWIIIITTCCRTTRGIELSTQV